MIDSNKHEYKIFDKVLINSTRGCSLYESDNVYLDFLALSQIGIITKVKHNRVLLHNGLKEMWFYTNDISLINI